MKPTNLFAAIAFVLVSIGAAHAQSASADAMESALRDHLPEWWSITSFEVTEREPVAAVSNAKPGTAPAAAPAVFAATLELAEQTYIDGYSLGGAAFVDEGMAPGLTLRITGTIARDGEVVVNEAGLDDLGRPLSDYETQAYVIGSPEAEAFLEEQANARADGDVRKLLNDEGTEL